MHIDMLFIIAVYLVSLDARGVELKWKKERDKKLFDIIYDSTFELMRGMGFLENYRGSANEGKSMRIFENVLMKI